jgi:uncharacterized protein DUF4386
MTRRTNAKVAGFAFLIYIAAALPAMLLSGRATNGEGTAAKLASVAQHASDLRLVFMLDLIACLCALVLAVTLWAITRDADPDLAMLGLTCRVAEGVIGATSLDTTLGRLWLATAAGADAPDPAATNALAAVLLKLPGWMIGAPFFAVGSTIFAYLLLRGRIVPVSLAWIGVVGSLLAVVVLPLMLAGVVSGPITQLIWAPLLVFEVWLALWLIIKGAAMPARRQAS